MITFDHPALFQAVKARDIKKLHAVLGPTLNAFGSYQIKYWDHARDGIMTSLNSIPGVQGYDCLRWAEQILCEAHKISRIREPYSCHSEYVYKLRANLLERAVERIPDFKPPERQDIWISISETIATLDDELSEENSTKKEWLVGTQGQVKKMSLAHIS
jgi:hypothetical protein